LPSVFENEASAYRFLCEYTTDDAFQQVFTCSLKDYIQKVNVEALVFKAANKTWTLQVMDDGQLNAAAFSNFCTDLFYRPFSAAVRFPPGWSVL